MKNYLLHLLLFILFLSCGKPIIIKFNGERKEEVVTYSSFLDGKRFFIDKSISPDFEDWIVYETSGSFSNSSIIKYDKALFSGDLSGNIYYFSDSSDSRRGVLKHKGSIEISPVIIKGQLIFAVNEFNQKYSTIYFYSIGTGKYLKEIKLYDNLQNEFAVLDDSFFVLTQNGLLIKYGSSGKKEWQLELDAEVYSDPIINDGKLFILTSDGFLKIISGGKGNLIKSLKLSESFESAPYVCKSYIVACDTYGNVFKYDYNGEQLHWESHIGSKILAEPVGNNSREIFIADLSGKLTKLSGDDGRIVWQYNSSGILNTAPLVFNNLIIQTDQNKKVHLIDLNGNSVKIISFPGRIKMKPAFIDGVLFIGGDDGLIYSYKVNPL